MADIFRSAQCGRFELALSDAVSGKVIVSNVGTASYGSSVIAGDFDGNGIIDAFDLALARRTMLNEFSGSTAPIDMRTADLNGRR